VKRSKKQKVRPQYLAVFTEAFPRTVPGTDKNVRTVRVTGVRASFARNDGAKGGLAKSADAQRQAFTRALKGVLPEGLVNQDSWDGADWLWREDE
jgi:hypothetical protein